MTANEEFGVSIMAHPKPHQVSVSALSGTPWLDFGGSGYSSMSVCLNAGVADAIIAALRPYATELAA